MATDISNSLNSSDYIHDYEKSFKWKLPLDFTLSLIFLLVFSVLMALIALIIKLDSPGPVFFRQQRVGLNNRIFYIWKFRTMTNKAADVNGAELTTRNDPRITRVGKFLRKTSLDELPQFFNVLCGDMSIVGPRPHPLQAKVGDSLYAALVENYNERHKVKPGITGWAQVNGWRGETNTPNQIIQRVAYDIHYINNATFLLDIKIMLLTLISLSGKHVF